MIEVNYIHVALRDQIKRIAPANQPGPYSFKLRNEAGMQILTRSVLQLIDCGADLDAALNGWLKSYDILPVKDVARYISI